jgi:putative hydrolase of the HAD superfamily
LDQLGLSPHFETITVSAIEGVEKPAPEIFSRTMKSLQIAPSAALHIGDSPLEDYRGARDAGLEAVLIDRRGLFEDDGYRRVSSLNEIVDLLP